MNIGELFTKYGSDKDTNHKYGEFYQGLFKRPEEVENILEIGIAHGGGLLGFRDYFTNANCIGFDNQYSPCSGERIEIHRGDHRDYEEVMKAVDGRMFDLIVEDSSHVTDDNLRCLFWLWPFVKPGGYYVAEEWSNVHRDRICFDLFKGCRLVETPYPFKPGHPVYNPDEPTELLVVLQKDA
jgi:cephalosporin hydroxylase